MNFASIYSGQKTSITSVWKNTQDRGMKASIIELLFNINLEYLWFKLYQSDDLQMIASPLLSNSSFLLFSQLASKLFQLPFYPNFLPLHFLPCAQIEQQRATKPS